MTGCDDFDAYWRFEFFWHILAGFILAGVGAIVAIGYVGYRVWNEIALEISYQQKYGAGWRIEFERYHGSLSHIHLRLFIVAVCLLALVVVLIWFFRQFCRSHRRRRQHHAASREDV